MYINDILRKMGFSSTTYSEVIITLTKGGEKYSMPIGVKYLRKRFEGRIYRKTRIADIILSQPEKISVCVTRDPIIFYRAVLEKEKLEYIEVSHYEAPCIVGCDACIICNIESISETNEWLRIVLNPVHTVIYNVYPRPFHRVEYGIVEALVYYTKLPYVDRATAEKYYNYILVFRETVYRSTTDKKYRAIIDKIVAKAKEVLNKR